MVDLLIRLYIPGKRVELQSQLQHCRWHLKFYIYILTWLLSRQLRGFHFWDFVVFYYLHFNLFSYGEGNEKKELRMEKRSERKVLHTEPYRGVVKILCMWYTLRSTIFLPSSSLACSSPFPICPSRSLSASFIWKRNTNKKFFGHCKVYDKKYILQFRLGPLPHNLRHKYTLHILRIVNKMSFG